MSSINNYYSLSDLALVELIGEQLKKIRLRANLTQTELAEKSGLARASISRIESGNAASIITLIQVLRALEKLENLELLFEKPPINPIAYAKLLGKERKRASSKKTVKKDNTVSEW